MRTVYRFYDYADVTNYTFTATFTVDWTVSGNTITINNIYYNDDPSPSVWYVASGMRFGVQWEGDANPTTIVDGQYNFSYASGVFDYVTTANGGGFKTVNGVLGVFSDAGNHCPISHTFSGGTAGFKIWFGSTKGTLNYGNPAPYRLVDYQNGDVSTGIALDYRPGERLISGSWKSLNRSGGKCERIGAGEMKTTGGGTESGNPPERMNSGWKNQKKLGAEQGQVLFSEDNYS